MNDGSCATQKAAQRSPKLAQGPLVGQPVESLPNKGHREAHAAWVASQNPPPWARPGAAAPPAGLGRQQAGAALAEPDTRRSFWAWVTATVLVVLVLGAILGHALDLL